MSNSCWQLKASKLYQRILFLFFIFMLIELNRYWQLGYPWHAILAFTVFILSYGLARRQEIRTLRYHGGLWEFVTASSCKIYGKRMYKLWYSSQAMVFIVKIWRVPYVRIVVLFSDQFNQPDEHILRLIIRRYGDGKSR